MSRHSFARPPGRRAPRAVALALAVIAAPALAAASAACTVTPLSRARAQDAARLRTVVVTPAVTPAVTPVVTPRAAPSPTSRGAGPAASFAWPGTYDVVGTGFPEGDRHAVATFTRRDTAYAVDLAGPPGRPLFVRVAADTAYVEWELAPAAAPMYLWLRGAGDSLSGMWLIGDQVGLLRGRRRP